MKLLSFSEVLWFSLQRCFLDSLNRFLVRTFPYLCFLFFLNFLSCSLPPMASQMCSTEGCLESYIYHMLANLTTVLPQLYLSPLIKKKGFSYFGLSQES